MTRRHRLELRPFACPECGATDHWRAQYWQPANQGVVLRVDARGRLVPLDYAGDEDINGDASDNDAYACEAPGGCGRVVEVGRFVFRAIRKARRA